jgi:hypothetical protein
MSPHMKENITLHQSRYCSDPLAWRLPLNMNIEQGDSMKVDTIDHRTILRAVVCRDRFIVVR